MKLRPWLLAGALILLTRTFVEVIPTLPKLLSVEADAKHGQDQSQASNQDVCQSARSSVVTLFAGKDFGAGSIVRSDGIVITNHHVVREAEGGKLWVRTWSGQQLQGQVLATDDMNDLAIVQLLNIPDTLPTIPLAKLDGMQVSQDVCAIGSPFGRAGIISRGKVTGVRENGDLQTEILLHPGNSGGPLLNDRGEMIGVNKSIWVSDSGQNTGISFATTATVVDQFLVQHQDKATIAHSSNPDSIAVDTPTTPIDVNVGGSPTVPADNQLASAPTTIRLGVIINTKSFLIQVVEPNSPAELAGLNAGDRLIAINGERLTSFDQLKTFLSDRPDLAILTIDRNQQLQDFQVTF